MFFNISVFAAEQICGVSDEIGSEYFSSQVGITADRGSAASHALIVRFISAVSFFVALLFTSRIIKSTIGSEFELHVRGAHSV